VVVGVTVGRGVKVIVDVAVSGGVPVGVTVTVGRGVKAIVADPVVVGVTVGRGVKVIVDVAVSGGVPVVVSVTVGRGVKVNVEMCCRVGDALELTMVITTSGVVPVSATVRVLSGAIADTGLAVVACGMLAATNSAAIQASSCDPVTLTRYQLPSEEIPTTLTPLPRTKNPICLESPSGSKRKGAISTITTTCLSEGVIGIGEGSEGNSLLRSSIAQATRLIIINKKMKRNL
jgi:hypothetical protein